MTESPLLVQPYIKELTVSELFTVMTAGFGSAAGSVLGAFVGFGVSCNFAHLSDFRQGSLFSIPRKKNQQSLRAIYIAL